MPWRMGTLYALPGKVRIKNEEGDDRVYYDGEEQGRIKRNLRSLSTIFYCLSQSRFYSQLILLM
jgi:hypothetical protein